MPSGNYTVIMCPPRCQVTPMGGYRTVQSSDWNDSGVPKNWEVGIYHTVGGPNISKGRNHWQESTHINIFLPSSIPCNLLIYSTSFDRHYYVTLPLPMFLTILNTIQQSTYMYTTTYIFLLSVRQSGKYHNTFYIDMLQYTVQYIKEFSLFNLYLLYLS